MARIEIDYPSYFNKSISEMTSAERRQLQKDVLNKEFARLHPEQVKKFDDMLKGLLDNAGNGVQIKSDTKIGTNVVPAYIISALKMPLEKRCLTCGKPISIGKYCEECGKDIARNNY